MNPLKRCLSGYLVVMCSLAASIASAQTPTAPAPGAAGPTAPAEPAKSNVVKDFDTIGNDALLEKAKALQPDADVSVVQDRLVDRHLRFEISPEYSAVLGGDPYTNSRDLGLNFQFHINPYVSVGAKYDLVSNELSSEGQSLISAKNGITGKASVPDIDYAANQTLGIIDIYPFYGKLKVFNRVTHFDVYGLLGYGTINLRSGPTSTWTGGAGVGFWITQNFSARWELRYQNYTAQRYDGPAAMNLTVSSLQMGLML
jgi:outer membrane beta-barrel protein